MSKPAPPTTPVTVAAAFKKAKAAAINLNNVSDGLSHVVAEAEAIFKDFNIGLPAFVQFAGHADYEAETFWSRQLGYVRLGDKGWRIVIRTKSGDFGDPESEESETWVFDEAPRAYRADAVDVLPQLLEALGEEAEKTASGLTEKIAFVQQFNAALKEAATEVADANLSPVLQELNRQNAKRAPQVSQAPRPAKPVRG